MTSFSKEDRCGIPETNENDRCTSEPDLIPPQRQIIHRIEVEASAKSRSILGFVVGRPFHVRYIITNIGSTVFPGGTLTITVKWPNDQHQRSRFIVPELKPSQRYIVDKDEKGSPLMMEVLAPGYVLFTAELEANDGNPVVIESPPGQPKSPDENFYLIFAKSIWEVYEQIGLLAALAILMCGVAVESLSLIVRLEMISLNKTLIPTLLVTITATSIYFFGLGNLTSRKLLKLVLVGTTIGAMLVSSTVTLVMEITRYDQLQIEGPLLYAPLFEETSKFLGLLFLTRILLPYLTQVNKYETTRIGGGIGLGFGFFETLTYILGGVSYNIAISRLLIAMPFHVGSAMLISYGEAERRGFLQLLLLLSAIAFHILFNLLAIYNMILQGAISWAVLSFLYVLSSRLYFKEP